MSANFRIAETELAVSALGTSGYRKLREKLDVYVYPQLRRNPHYGPNIKKLKGELSDFWRYRVGHLRIFYTIDEEERLVLIHEIQDRKQAYRKK